MRPHSPLFAAVVLASILLSVPPVMAQPVARDGLLTTAAGMSLYTNDNDKTVPGKTICYGPCLMLWTPYLASADAQASAELGFIIRDDGKRQWTYKNMPLYLWVDDKQPGDRKGDGVRTVWHLARP